MKDLTVEKEILSLDNKSKVDNIEPSNEESNYTTSPDGKYKSLITSEYDSDRFEENKTNIPQIKIPGYVVSAPHDKSPNSIQNMLDKGWQFVTVTESPAAKRKIYAGTNTAGEAAFHYLMKMPESKFKEIQAREEQHRKNLLESVAKAPSEESSAIYATDQMKINRGRSQ